MEDTTRFESGLRTEAEGLARSKTEMPFSASNQEKFLYIFLIVLGIFVAGVQVGIHQGRELQIQEFQEQYEYTFTD
ncbi:MAG: hypothetical protein LKG27_02485 [Clostridiaceae bacterium]|jgi:hypothetical protein|nr:hypothetical protein [Clostridiaceae bacterium]